MPRKQTPGAKVKKVEHKQPKVTPVHPTKRGLAKRG